MLRVFVTVAAMVLAMSVANAQQATYKIVEVVGSVTDATGKQLNVGDSFTVDPVNGANINTADGSSARVNVYKTALRLGASASDLDAEMATLGPNETLHIWTDPATGKVEVRKYANFASNTPPTNDATFGQTTNTPPPVDPTTALIIGAAAGGGIYVATRDDNNSD